MRMIITKDKAINIDYITALEIEVNFSEYNLETRKVEKVANPIGYLWAITTAGSHIIKVVREVISHFFISLFLWYVISCLK